MQSLLFCAISWISFTISYKLTALGSRQNLEVDTFGDAPVDPTLIDNKPNFEHMSPLDQIADPYSNMFDDSRDRYLATEQDMNIFIPEDVNPHEMTDSSLLLAEDSFCDLDDIDELYCFVKCAAKISVGTLPWARPNHKSGPKRMLRCPISGVFTQI